MSIIITHIKVPTDKLNSIYLLKLKKKINDKFIISSNNTNNLRT